MDNTLHEIEQLVFFHSSFDRHSEPRQTDQQPQRASSISNDAQPQQASSSSASSSSSPLTRFRMLANLITPTADAAVPLVAGVEPSTPPMRSVSSFETTSPFSLVHAPTDDDLADDLSTCRLIPPASGGVQAQSGMTPRKFLSRIFGGLGVVGPEKGKAATKSFDGGPLDGEEGELVDEGCFVVDPKDVVGFDFMSMLPFELALEVFRHLDLHSILACSAVSGNWRVMARDMKVWRDLFLRQPGWKINTALAASRRTNVPPGGGLVPPPSNVNPSTSTASRPFALSFVLPSSSQSLNADIPSPSGSPNPNEDDMSSSTETLVGRPLPLDWLSLFRTRRELERRWTDPKFQPTIKDLVGHLDSVYCLEFDADRNFIVTGSRDRTIRFWDLSSGALRHTVWNHHSGSVLCLRINIEEGLMVTGSSDKTVIVWQVGPIAPNGTPAFVKATDILRGHNGGVLDVRIGEKWLVSCSKDSRIRVWSRQDYSLHCELIGHEGPVNAVGMQNNLITTASGDGKIILWDIDTGKRIRTFSGHNRGLACIDFQGDYIISGSNDRNIKIWAASTGECLKTLPGHDGLVRALAFDAKLGRLVSASYDKTVRIWDIDFKDGRSVSAKFVRELKDHHSSHIFDIKFDTGRIVTSSHDESVVVMDFAGQDIDTALFI